MNKTEKLKLSIHHAQAQSKQTNKHINKFYLITHFSNSLKWWIFLKTFFEEIFKDRVVIRHYNYYINTSKINYWFISVVELRTCRREKGKMFVTSQFIIPSHENRDCNLMSPTVFVYHYVLIVLQFSVGLQIELFSGGM